MSWWNVKPEPLSDYLGRDPFHPRSPQIWSPVLEINKKKKRSEQGSTLESKPLPRLYLVRESYSISNKYNSKRSVKKKKHSPSRVMIPIAPLGLPGVRVTNIRWARPVWLKEKYIYIYFFFFFFISLIGKFSKHIHQGLRTSNLMPGNN